MATVLVLGVGGVLGEAWMWGYLGGLRRAGGQDPRRAKQLIGTSAGSIVAARLAGGEDPARGEERVRWDGEAEPERRTSALRAAIEGATRISMGALSPLAAPALMAATPGGALARAAVLARVPSGRIELRELRSRVEALGPAFDDGRLNIVAVDRGSGRRVVFGSDSAPDASVAEAVAASCAVPGLFAPVDIAGREYVDGGVWSPTNLDLASAGSGDRVLCLVPTAVMGTGPAIALRGLAAGWRMATSVEAAAARRRGAEVEIVAPDPGSARAMGTDLMNPGRRASVLAEGFRQGSAREG
ncbi:MAG TPA: patatin-like phospholipase family protein [Thermoleophilaceae bacterium]|nr:patatin-like phospholipase family protein [Thermoleophilaceae bacterium]